MSWLFRSNSVKRQFIDKGEEKQVEHLYKQLSEVEQVSRQVYKSMKRHIEAYEDLNKTEQRLWANLADSPAMNFNDSLRQTNQAWIPACKALAGSSSAISTNLTKQFVEPVRSYHQSFSAVHADSKKRSAALDEAVKCRGKVEKVEPTDEKLATAMAKAESAETQYKTIHSATLKFLPHQLYKRQDVLSSALSDALASKLSYCEERAEIYDSLLRSTGADQALISMDEATAPSALLARIHALAIVK